MSALLLKIVQSNFRQALPAVILIAVYVLTAHFRIMVRAHLFSLLLFNLYIFALWQYQRGRRSWLWALPVFTIAWVNLHSGVIFGLGLVLLVAAETCLPLVIGNQRKTAVRRLAWRDYGLVLVAVFAATLANPQGGQYLIHTFNHLRIGDLMPVIEYLPAHNLGPMLMFFWLLADCRFSRPARISAWD